MDDRAPDRTPSLLGDEDVRARLTPALAVESATRALVDAHRGRLAAPPRTSAVLGPVSMVFTAGGYAGGPAGFRAYGTWAGDSDQAVLVCDGHGWLVGVVAGSELGPRRTGALGAASAAALARRDAWSVAVVGAGPQAWTQLWALTAVIDAPDVRVFSPTTEHREAFAVRAGSELGLAAAAVGSAEDAVRRADVAILATRADRPVIDAAWIAGCARDHRRAEGGVCARGAARAGRSRQRGGQRLPGASFGPRQAVLRRTAADSPGGGVMRRRRGTRRRRRDHAVLLDRAGRQ
jgi:ornithine cyclodeaminase